MYCQQHVRAKCLGKFLVVSVIALMVLMSEGFSSTSLRHGINRFARICSPFDRQQSIQHAFIELENKKESSLLLNVKATAAKMKKPLVKVPTPEMGVGELVNLLQTNNVAKPKAATKEDVGQADKEMGQIVLTAFATVLLCVGGIAYQSFHLSPELVVDWFQRLLQDPTTSLEAVVNTVDSMGPMGMLYFGVIYVIAEILAIPGFPLVASAGYLFGVVEGTAVILASATIAASVSFWIGRTALRSYVEDFLKDQPDLRKIDRAIEKQGFKLMLLLRLSPIFPFALSNYVYGASSVAFWEFFWGTAIGFFPGTLGYVYAGVVGKALTLGGDNVQPWYIYAGGLIVLSGFLKIMADVATEIVNEIEEENAE